MILLVCLYIWFCYIYIYLFWSFLWFYLVWRLYFCDNHYFIGKSGFCWWFLFLDFPTKKQTYLRNIFWGSENFLGMDNFQFWEGRMQNPFWKIWRSILCRLHTARCGCPKLEGFVTIHRVPFFLSWVFEPLLQDLKILARISFLTIRYCTVVSVVSSNPVTTVLPFQ